MRGMKRLAADPMYPATGHTIAKPGPDPAKVASANGAPVTGTAWVPPSEPDGTYTGR